MDFFERQDRALKNTRWLVLYFIVGVGLMVLAVYTVLLLIFGMVDLDHPRRAVAALGWWNPQLLMWAAGGTSAVVGFGSLYKTLELSGGGSAVAEMLGGSLVQPHTTDPDERRLLNVVEEMALAAGIPVPQVYVLRREKAINAFAAGHHTGNAVVGVTDGTLRLLNRDELQGVIAHEFSHILYGDMRLNLRLIGILFGIVCLASIGRVLLRARGGDRERNALPLLGLALLAIGWIGYLFGRLIQAAVSRQREFLADAAAVQFTRNPEGLAGALKKIGGLSYGARLQAPQAGEASHLFFGDAMAGSFSGLFATHPPLVERIRAIDPNFDGVFPRVSLQSGSRTGLEGAADPVPRISTRSEAAALALGLAAPPVISAPGVAASVGTSGSPQLRYAQQLRDEFPPNLRQSVDEPLGACAIVYALLLSQDDDVREHQQVLLLQETSHAALNETLRIFPAVRDVAERARLPLVDLAMPQLRRMAPPQFFEFRAAVDALSHADEQIELFEYVLQKAVVRHLESNFVPARRSTPHYYSLQPLAQDCAVLLSSLAYAGHDDAEQIENAFAAGAAILRAHAGISIRLLPGAACGLQQIDSALTRLDLAAPPLKRTVVQACADTVATDGLIQETEWELLRVTSDTLDCPLPIRVDQRAAAAAAAV